MSQRRKHSFFEACASTAIGFAIAYIANLIVLPLFGFSPSLTANLWITLIYTLISIVRGYGVRRFFNWLHITGVL